MIAYLSEWENVVEQLNALCMSLFDRWCEGREVTLLAYLMHCWPMIDSTPHTIRRLGETMRDLRRHHGDQLDKYSFQALCEMADLIEELVQRPARNVRPMVFGDATGKLG